MPLEYARGVEDKAIGVVLQAMAGMAARCAGSDLQLRRKIYQVVYETRLKLATILNELVDEAGEPPLTPLFAAHPHIDPDRIALMGTSRGGRGALYASLKRFRDTWAPGSDFAAYILLYAACESPSVIGEEDVSDHPIRQFHGGSDDLVSIAPCQKFYERLRANGKDAKLTEFPKVCQLFDNPAVRPGPVAVKIQSLGACEVKEEKPGMLVNTST